MPYYRIRLEFLSPVGTPLISGTLWGHLAWAIRYLDGEDALLNWLQNQLERPWLLSSAMPVGCLPRPLLKPVMRRDRGTDLHTLEEMKKTRKVAYVREEDFLALRGAMSEENLQDRLIAYVSKGESLPTKAFRQARNRIDRRTSRTPESGGLYFLDDLAYAPGTKHEQFFIFTEEREVEQLDRLLAYISANGFGRKSSIGRGVFHFEIEEEMALFNGGGNRVMSLSHGLLVANMEDCRYKLHPHSGKVGGHLAMGKFSPFKYPILMMAPGATFVPKGRGPFGQILEGVHHDPALAGIRHHALHLPLYFMEATP